MRPGKENMDRLVIRNTPDGCIWQVYFVKDLEEFSILRDNAHKNGFMSVRLEPMVEGDEETWPGWRETESWKKCLKESQYQNLRKE